MNRAAFYTALRSRTSGVFGTSLSAAQVEGCEAILDEAERRGTPLEHLAYIFATAYHESAFTMQPVRETLAKSDASAVAILDRAFAKGQLTWVTKPYWRLDANGKSWLGRGLVQLTHKDNYDELGKLIGVDLVSDPGKAMDMATAVKIIFTGMELGSFTGKALDDYIKGAKVDYYNARSIINGDKKGNGAKIATQAKAFEAALRAGGYVASLPVPTVPAPAPSPVPAPIDPPKPAVIVSAPVDDGNWLGKLMTAIMAAFGGKK